MDGNTLLHQVAYIFVVGFEFLQTPLFYLGGKAVTFWNICLSLIGFSLFRDFLDIIGIWGYDAEDVEIEGEDF